MTSECPPKRSWIAHYYELLATWTRRSGSSHDAQDATHDAIGNLLAGDQAAITNPRGYLHSSVRNRLVDMHRHNNVLDTVPLQDLAEEDHPLLYDPEAQMRTLQLVVGLKEALTELPVNCRQVFLLHRLEGYSQQEVAERLGISVNMVEKHMIRVLRHLRERLRKHAPH